MKLYEEILHVLQRWKESNERMKGILERGLARTLLLETSLHPEKNQWRREEVQDLVRAALNRAFNEEHFGKGGHAFHRLPFEWDIPGACKLFEIGVQIFGSWKLEDIQLQQGMPLTGRFGELAPRFRNAMGCRILDGHPSLIRDPRRNYTYYQPTTTTKA